MRQFTRRLPGRILRIAQHNRQVLAMRDDSPIEWNDILPLILTLDLRIVGRPIKVFLPVISYGLNHSNPFPSQHNSILSRRTQDASHR